MLTFKWGSYVSLAQTRADVWEAQSVYPDPSPVLFPDRSIGAPPPVAPPPPSAVTPPPIDRTSTGRNSTTDRPHLSRSFHRRSTTGDET
ncbi:hypothetical protein E3N88_10750 [Mikania micrantha]|uniref:Uncharacterized protein n=1 Tax=Mikania micrantha TaxID=192012 RepID=A0A5N6PCM0_9ASTR|nr:hypothetical protein E3N88_10750 [Mikania micrantha]